MSYSEMTEEELILLSIEFVGRDVEIPDEVAALLGADLIGLITSPETHTDDKISKRPGHRPRGH